MKKGEIKRRKRVIPASHAPSPSTVYPGSAGPDNQPAHHNHQLQPNQDPSQQSTEPSSHPRSLYPPPVDFTNFRAPPTGNLSASDSQSARKRTHSEANDLSQVPSNTNGNSLPIHNDRRLPSPIRSEHRHFTHDSKPVVSSSHESTAIDPSLSHGITAAQEAEAKKQRLKEERARLRAQLEALDVQIGED